MQVGDETIREAMERRARETPEDVYCTFERQPLTIAALDAAVNRVANGLLASGLRKGDRVALMLPSHPDHVVAIFALAKVGLVRVPVNVHLKGAALAFVFEQLEPRALIADREYASQLDSQMLNGLDLVIWRGERVTTPSWIDLAAHPDATPPSVAPAPDDILAITPSSGTTGAPKGVLKSDRTLRAGPIATQMLTDRRRGDVLLLWEALHHGAGVAVLIGAVLERISLAMVPRFSASRFWNDARRGNATHIHYLGGVLPMLLAQPARADDRSHGVRIAWGGGCPAEVWRRFEDRFGVEIREGYGLSELVTFVLINRDGPEGSIGKPLPWYDIQLIDEQGNALPAGETGEIAVHARDERLGFLGYFRNAEATAAGWRERGGKRWYLTGDLGRRDDDGWFYYAGRSKDSVRRRGINISAWEVERVINEHPDVEESALVGVPGALGDDELLVYVRPVSGRSIDPDALIQWCEPRLPYFQVPRYVAAVDDFPRTPTQRVRKSEMSRDVAGVWDRDVARGDRPPR
ncbi:MAG TPA: AMP-binding protein [Casimicrobiaceae bacterium]|nr:AMP-binding protein [Casimicrobiaceae bacterium]